MPRPPGYHYVQTDEGTIVIEQDEPSQGFTTITWIPNSESPTVRGTITAPAGIFEQVVDSYIGERDLARAKAKTAATAG